IGPVLLLAVVGVVVCTFTAGFALAPISSMGLLACIALGAIIATTDPVAVVGVFRAVGAPRRLSTLVEGESLFNDAAAIAIYAVGRRRLTPSNWENLVESWEKLAFWASWLIFLFAAMQAPEQVAIIKGQWLEYFGLLAALIAAALVARAITLYGLIPML